MPIGWAIGGAAVLGVVGSAISANAQSNAAQTAAQAQQNAAQLQANTSADIYNSQQIQNNPSRTAGGEALAEESYLLGLNPNLNIAGDTSIAQINPQLNNTSNSGGVTYSGPGSNSINQTYFGSSTNPSTGLPNNWGTPAGGSNVNGGYGTINGVPTGNSLNTSNTAPGTATAQGIGGSGVPITTGTGTSGQAPGAGPTPGSNGYGGPSVNPLSGTANNSSGGYGSLSSVYNPNTFYNDPSYQFQMQQQQLALNKQEAASGGLYSTGALQNSLQYAQGLAATDYQNAFARSQSAQNQQFNYLQALTGGGQVGTNNVTAAGNSAASNIGSAATGYGNAAAAGAIGSANAVTNGINQAGGFAGNAINQYGNYLNNGGGYNGYGTNPQNLGGSTPVAPAGSTLNYDSSGNIIGSSPITS